MPALTRRQFLAQGATLATLPAVAAAVEQPVDTEVLIVGAGIAGLSCGKTLRDAGRNVRIVEARSRIGGRIHTSRKWDQTPVELGARWIHGSKENPLLPIVREIGLTTIATDYDSIEGFRSDGTKYTLDQLAEAFLDEQNFEKYLDSRRDEGFRGDQRKSLADLLSDWPIRSTMEPQRRRLFELALRCETTLDYAAEPQQLAWPGFDHGRWLQGQDLSITEGYDRIVDHLARDLPIDQEVIVREIDIVGVTPIVRTSKGDFTAKHVVITVPLGVLKVGSIRFRPGLPREKREAIRLLGMGHVSKIALRFPKIFWPRRELFLFEGSAEESFDTYHLGVWTGEPVLQTYQAGQAALKEESLTPEQRVEGTLAHLRKAFAKGFVQPADFQMTDWSNDPFSKGAYSFVKTGSIPQHREDLALPVDGKLFFAGEATHLDHPSTVHGAYLSGIREAKRLLQA